MIRLILSVLAVAAFVLTSSAQSSVAKIKYGQAEEAYNAGNYSQAYEYIQETEKLVGQNTRTLYLKILIQNKLITQASSPDFALVQSARQNCASYLKSTEGSADLEDKFKEVYFISEGLKKYPSTQQEYEAFKQKAEEERLARVRQQEEQQRQAEERQRQEQLRVEEQRRYEEEIERKKIGYFGIKVGLAAPLNSDSKSSITYNEWLNDENYSPFSVGLERGRFGLKNGFTVGFNGIAGFNQLNANLQKVGLGLMIDFSTTLLFYDIEASGVPEVHRWYFEDYEKTAFGITSLGVGPALSFRLGNGNLKLDTYFRTDVNVYYGGSYSASTYQSTDDDSYMADVDVYRDGVSVNVSPTIGVDLRGKSVYGGFEFRLGLKDNATFTDNLDYYSDYYGSAYATDYVSPSDGIKLSYISAHIGVAF